jgi:hypothetical protein
MSHKAGGFCKVVGNAQKWGKNSKSAIFTNSAAKAEKIFQSLKVFVC